MSTTRNKKNRVSFVTQLITGTNKNFPNGDQQLPFGGTTRTVTALTTLLQSIANARNAVAAAQAASKAAIAAERTQTPSLLAVMDEYVAFVRATFGSKPDVLAEFGLTPHKASAPQSTEQKAAAAAKRTATRKARYTMGKNQKKAVKGDVTGVVMTPITAASPAGNTPSPATAAPVIAPPTPRGNAP
jgi:hypothetical protein